MSTSDNNSSSAAKGSPPYLFQRDDQASARLTFQHHALKTRQGWLFHPSITTHLSSLTNPIIADLATGNAIWAYDAATSYPNAKVIGLDISPLQYPPPLTHPPNVTLDVWGFLDPVPDEYVGVFDVVHIRIVAAAIYDMDKDALMRNILCLVKPGGMVQWDELCWSWALNVDRDGNVGEFMHEAVRKMYTHSDFDEGTKWALRLPEVFESCGLTDVVGYRPPVLYSNLVSETQGLTWAMREIIGLAVEQGKDGAEETYELAMRDVEEMRKDGGFWAYPWIVAVGRKPL